MKIVRSTHSVDCEIEALKKCRGHPNIVSFVEVIKDEAFTYIVMEWLAGVELFEYAVDNVLEETEVRRIFVKLLNAVEFMHSKRIIHRDLKLENIKFADANARASNIKVLDFGFACRKSEAYRKRDNPSYSIEYAAPEIMLNKKFDEGCDLWSLGVILFTMLCGHMPFMAPDGKDNTSSAILKRAEKGAYYTESERYRRLSPNAKSLISRLLTADQRDRVTLEMLSYHRWFKADDAKSRKTTMKTRNSSLDAERAREAVILPKPERQPPARPVAKLVAKPQPAVQVAEEVDVYSEVETESEPGTEQVTQIELDPEPVSASASAAEQSTEQDSELDLELDAIVEQEPEPEMNESEADNELGEEVEIDYESEEKLEHDAELESAHATAQDAQIELDAPEDLEPVIAAVEELSVESSTVAGDGAGDGPCDIDTAGDIVCIELSPDSEKVNDDDDVDADADAGTPESGGADELTDASRSSLYEDAVDETTLAQKPERLEDTATAPPTEAPQPTANDLNGIYMADNTITTNVENLNNNNEKYIDTTGSINVDEFVANSMYEEVIQQETFDDMPADVIVSAKTNGDISQIDLFEFIDDDNMEIDPYEFEDDEEQEFCGFAANDPSLLRNIGRLIDLRKEFMPVRLIHYDEPDVTEYDNEPTWNDASRKRKRSDSSDIDPSYGRKSRSRANGSFVPKRLRRRRLEVC